MLDALLLFVAAALAPGAPAFDAWSTGRTLRCDLLHGGDAASEHLELGGFRLEGPWPGPREASGGDPALGLYVFRVVEPAGGRVLYAQGSCSIFGEWQTTAEARSVPRAFEESYRFPEPREPVRLEWLRRKDDGRLATLLKLAFDPKDLAIDRSPVAPAGTAFVLAEQGDPAAKVDLLILGDGYVAGDAARFQDDAVRLTEALFAVEPFRSRRSAFNVRARVLPARERGVSRPRQDVWKRSPLGISYNAFGIDRYVLTFRNREVREAAAADPYDLLVILFDDARYGGGGIYNLWATCAAGNAAAAQVFVHELGHAFAGLADEYYSSEVAYETPASPAAEPWEPNVTALADAAALKWKDLVALGTPLPTPWGQEAYDRADLAWQGRRKALSAAGAPDAALDEASAEARAAAVALLEKETHAGRVGAFEGAAYRAKGLYRPEVDCIMFRTAAPRFCGVCARALEHAIDQHCR